MEIDQSSILQACEHMVNGGVIAYPTEGVWGLGCDPWNEKAVDKVLELKQREKAKGLILAAADIQQLDKLTVSLSAEQIETLNSAWPGPVTFLIPDYDHYIPDWIKGEHRTVAARVSSHPLVNELCSVFTKPIVSTSANPADDSPALTEEEVRQYFGDRLDYILSGELGGQQGPSEIRDLISGRVFR